MKKLIIIFFIIIAIPASYKLFRIYQHKQDLNRAQEISIGKVVPNIILKDENGNKFSLREKKGKNLVIVFWASWCHQCLKEIPHIKSFYGKIKDNPEIELISIAIDENSKDSQKIIDLKGINYPVYFDKIMPNGEWQYVDKFQVVGVPSIWLIDKDSKIVALNLRSIERLEKLIK